MLKVIAKKLGLGELEQFKKCIMKVPILAQCLTAEKAKVTSRTVAASAAPSAYTPLLSGEDEGQCSKKELYEEIKKLNSDGHVPTRELIACYRELHDNLEKSIKLNAQIEDSPNKEFYKKIRLLLEVEVLNMMGYESEYIYKELLAKRRRILGEDHPDTLESLFNLAYYFFYHHFDDYDRTQPLFEELLAKQKRLLGEDHPYTLESLKRLDNIEKRRQKAVEKEKEKEKEEGTGAKQQAEQQAEQRKQQLEKEQKELEDSLEASRRNLGKDPTDTLALLRKLADFFEKKREYDRALPLYEECLDISKRVLGEYHPETLKSLNDIYKVLNMMGYESEYIYKELLAKRRRVLGEDHPDTLESLFNLAFYFFYRRHDYDRAQPLFEELLAKQKRLLGDDHPHTLASIINLANIEKRRQKKETGASLGGKSKNKRNHKNKSFRSTRRRRRYSRARGGKKIAASSSKTIKRRRKNAR